MSPFTLFSPRATLTDADPREDPVGVWTPPVGVYETGADLVAEVEVPGTPAGDIRV